MRKLAPATGSRPTLRRRAATVIMPAALALTAVFGTAPALAGELSGSARYLERMALPPGTELTAVLVDVVTGEEVPVEIQASAPAGTPPYHFTLDYDETALSADGDYELRLTLVWNDRPFFSATMQLDGLQGENVLVGDVILERGT